MLLVTLCSDILPIQIAKETKTKSALYLVFSKEKPNMISFSSTGHWDDSQEFLFWDSKENKTVYNKTCPQYTTLLDEQFTSDKAVYSPTALLSAGFLTSEMFEGIASSVVKALATLGGVPLDPELDCSNFYRSRLFAKTELGKTYHLPGSTLDMDDEVNPVKSAVVVETTAEPVK